LFKSGIPRCCNAMGNEYKLVDGYLRTLMASIRQHSLALVQHNTFSQLKQ